MNLINLVIIVITILEMILFIFYLLNSDVKQNDKRLLIISMRSGTVGGCNLRGKRYQKHG